MGLGLGLWCTVGLTHSQGKAGAKRILCCGQCEEVQVGREWLIGIQHQRELVTSNRAPSPGLGFKGQYSNNMGGDGE